MRPALVLALCIAVAPASLVAGPTGTPAELPAGLTETAKEAVRATLAAPHTANFRRIGGFRLSDGGWAVCGQVNSRNLAGLAMGWKPLYVRFAPDGLGGITVARRIVDWPADVACRQLAMGRPLRTRK